MEVFTPCHKAIDNTDSSVNMKENCVVPEASLFSAQNERKVSRCRCILLLQEGDRNGVDQETEPGGILY